jgi:hypothetical protein
MDIRMRKALKEAMWKRYRRAPKAMKTKILDELCAVTGYHRQYAIAQLNQMEDIEPRAWLEFRNESKPVSYPLRGLIRALPVLPSTGRVKVHLRLRAFPRPFYA